MKRLMILNGPNLNLLGTREPHVYGTTTLAEIERLVRAHAAAHGAQITWHQTNSEGELVDLVQALPKTADGALQVAYTLTIQGQAVPSVLTLKPEGATTTATVSLAGGQLVLRGDAKKAP